MCPCSVGDRPPVGVAGGYDRSWPLLSPQVLPRPNPLRDCNTRVCGRCLLNVALPIPLFPHPSLPPSLPPSLLSFPPSLPPSSPFLLSSLPPSPPPRIPLIYSTLVYYIQLLFCKLFFVGDTNNKHTVITNTYVLIPVLSVVTRTMSCGVRAGRKEGSLCCDSYHVVHVV